MGGHPLREEYASYLVNIEKSFTVVKNPPNPITFCQKLPPTAEGGGRLKGQEWSLISTPLFLSCSHEGNITEKTLNTLRTKKNKHN